MADVRVDSTRYNPGLLQAISRPGVVFPQIELGAESRWRVDFWIGGWDCDALCAHTQGAIQIPYTTDQT